MQKIHIIGGGTVFHLAPHLAISAPAYGKVVKDLFSILVDMGFPGMVHCYTTRMAGNQHTIWTARSGVEDVAPLYLETNNDIAALLDKLCIEPEPKIIFLPAALCDFKPESVTSSGSGDGMSTSFGKDQPRWETGKTHGHGRGEEYAVKHELTLVDAEKVINRIRKERKDIFLVGFKTTAGAAPEKQFEKGLTLLKKASCNLVLANDIRTKMNMIITPENVPYEPSLDRRYVLRELVNMAVARSRGHFTRSLVAEGKPVKWASHGIPSSLRKVVNWCIEKGAYKPFLGSTVGHFAFKVENNKFVTSRRSTNFNNLEHVGMVTVEVLDDDRVLAYGSKPSVGGQSQRIIFKEHPDVDCIVHFHCPLREESKLTIPVAEQWPYECGSHECGKNTSDHLKTFETGLHNPTVAKLVGKGPYVKAVMLDKHGPNIVFHRDIDPDEVIQFIDQNWDLSRSTSELDLPKAEESH